MFNASVNSQSNFSAELTIDRDFLQLAATQKISHRALKIFPAPYLFPLSYTNDVCGIRYPMASVCELKEAKLSGRKQPGTPTIRSARLA